MSSKPPSLSYYSFDKVYSYNATFMFVVGARGLGKTYGAKKRVIQAAIRNGEQFIYLRRYKTELKGFSTFFADIAHEFPDWDFKIQGNKAFMSKSSDAKKDEKKRNWICIGYSAALSNAQTQKSVAYPMVTTIIFDEFIIEKGALRYLPEEARAFNDFYSTVDRWKDKTRVLFLANAMSIMNPYFIEYDIKPDADKPEEFVRKADGFIVAHFADSAEFSTEVFQTKFGRFIKDTEYAVYSVNSKFADNNDRMIGFKPSQAKYYCTIETRAGTFSVWIDWSGPFYYVQSKRPKQEILYTFVPEWMDETKLLITYSDKIMQYLRSAFKGGKVFFDIPQARNAFTEIFRR